jgi:hypothetical protein
MDAAQDLDNQIHALRGMGLIVYGVRRNLILHANGAAAPWDEACVVILHEADARAMSAAA